MERPLGELDLAMVMIDGIRFAQHLLVVALGIDTGCEAHVGAVAGRDRKLGGVQGRAE